MTVLGPNDPRAIRQSGKLLGFCTHCWRVRWLASVSHHDSKGTPHGVCLSCDKEGK